MQAQLPILLLDPLALQSFRLGRGFHAANAPALLHPHLLLHLAVELLLLFLALALQQAFGFRFPGTIGRQAAVALTTIVCLVGLQAQAFASLLKAQPVVPDTGRLGDPPRRRPAR